MPLTKSGKKTLASMKKQYGAKKGKQVFYASINKGKPGSEKWERHGKKGNGELGYSEKMPLGDPFGYSKKVPTGKK